MILENGRQHVRLVPVRMQARMLLPLLLCGILTSACGKEEPPEPVQRETGMERKITAEDYGHMTELPDCLDYFYTILDDAGRKVYDCILDMTVQNRTDYEAVLYVPAERYETEAFMKYANEITDMMAADHTECYWTRSYWRTADSRITSFFEAPSFSDEKQGDYVRLAFSLVDAYPGLDAEQPRLEQAAADFLSDIDMTAPEAERAEAIHDKLIDLVSFDHSTYNKWQKWVVGNQDGESESEKIRPAFDKLDFQIFNAYGALVEDSNGPNLCVCSGYASAYQYLLKKAGIMAVQKTGVHGSTENPQEQHQWLAVRIDGKWQETDPTMDDVNITQLRITQEQKQELLDDAEFMYRIQHLFYGLTTEEMKKVRRNISYTFSDGTEKKLIDDTEYHAEDTNEKDSLLVFPVAE